MARVVYVKTVGLQKAIDRIAAYDLSRALHTLEAAALAGADVARRWIEEDMLEPKSGIHWPGLPVRSSRPGETPAVQSENLITSLNTRNVDSGDPHTGRAILGASATSEYGIDYAERLEFGDEKIAPRPYMRPAVTNNEDEIGQAMIDVCNKEWALLNAKVGAPG